MQKTVLVTGCSSGIGLESALDLTRQGFRVLAACRTRRPGQKMVVLSNYATPDVRMRCAQLGVDAVFDKSNEIDALVDYCIVHGTQRAAAAGAPVNRSACS